MINYLTELIGIAEGIIEAVRVEDVALARRLDVEYGRLLLDRIGGNDFSDLRLTACGYARDFALLAVRDRDKLEYHLRRAGKNLKRAIEEN